MVLDLCAAPGGKATELGSRLKGRGLLVANDISSSRAKALMRNLELWGIENSLVTTETPRRLAQVFPEYFHKILIDAPCSGEGMFRKDPDVAKTWDPSRPDYFSIQQKEIVARGISMLRPGGMLLYSTCTFSPQENEGVISFILENFPQMELLDIPGYRGIFPRLSPVGKQRSPSEKMCQDLSPIIWKVKGIFLPFSPKRMKEHLSLPEKMGRISSPLLPLPGTGKKETAPRRLPGRIKLPGLSWRISSMMCLFLWTFPDWKYGTHMCMPFRGRAGICKRPEVSPLGSVSGRAEKKTV